MLSHSPPGVPSAENNDHYVSSISENGIAINKLCVADHLLQVNGVRMSGVTHAAVIETVSANLQVTLLVQRTYAVAEASKRAKLTRTLSGTHVLAAPPESAGHQRRLAFHRHSIGRGSVPCLIPEETPEELREEATGATAGASGAAASGGGGAAATTTAAAATSGGDGDDIPTLINELDSVTLTRGERGFGMSIVGPGALGARNGIFITSVAFPPASESRLREGHQILRVRSLDTDWIDLTGATNDEAKSTLGAADTVTFVVRYNPSAYRSNVVPHISDTDQREESVRALAESGSVSTGVEEGGKQKHRKKTSLLKKMLRRK